MTDHDQSQRRIDTSENELDRALDAALAKYSAVDPRTGLEDRVLANLRAQPDAMPGHAWWRWGLAIAITAVVIVAVGVASRSAKHSPQLVKSPAIATPQNFPARSSQTKTPAAFDATVAEMHSRPQPSKRNPAPARDAEPARSAALAENPKLDTFPSPRPLSEQEKLLLEYVQQNPEEAAMIAQAQTAFAQQLEMERNSMPQSDASPSLREQLE
jgi:hypothetical protein